MSERRMLDVTAFYAERYDGCGWPPESAADFMQWFAELLSAIPAEHRATAMIEIDSEGGYEGSHNPSIMVRYRRPESDADMAEREAKERAKAEAEAQRERELLARLQAKYGDGEGEAYKKPDKRA